MTKRLKSSDDPRTIKLRRLEEHHILRQMRSMDETVDVTFRVGTELFPAHRNVLSVASPMLRKMLYNGMKESKEKVVELNKFGASTWRLALNYIYGEAVQVPMTATRDVVQLLECARYYQLEGLEQAVVKGVVSKLDSSNCCELLVAAERFCCKKLKRKVLKYVAEGFVELCESNALVALDVDLMEEVVKSEALHVRSELDVLDGIVGWLNAADIATDGDMTQLTRHIQLSSLSVDDLRQVGQKSKDAKLAHLEKAVYAEFLNAERRRPAGSPIAVEKRIGRRRDAVIFTVTHLFHSLSSWALGERQYSPWMRDDVHGKWWCLMVCLERRRSQNVGVGLYVCWKEHQHDAGDNVVIQLFAHSPARTNFHVSDTRIVRSLHCSRDEASSGFTQSMAGSSELPNLRQLALCIVGNSIVFGATLHISC